MPENIPHPGEQHPEIWRRDLSPDALAGVNIGPAAPQPGQGARTAADLKQIHRRLRDLPDDRLDQLSVLPPGTRLQQGAVYLDLRRLDDGEFTARGDQEVDRGDWIVAKKQVDYRLWNYLIGVDEPERIGSSDEPM